MVGVDEGFHFGVVEVVFPVFELPQDVRSSATARIASVGRGDFVIRPDQREIRGELV